MLCTPRWPRWSATWPSGASTRCWTDFRGRPGTNTPNQDAYTQSIPLG